MSSTADSASSYGLFNPVLYQFLSFPFCFKFSFFFFFTLILTNYILVSLTFSFFCFFPISSHHFSFVYFLIPLVSTFLLEFDKKHLKKDGGYLGRNFVNITIKMKIIVQKLWMIKIIKLRLRNSDNEWLLLNRTNYLN